MPISWRQNSLRILLFLAAPLLLISSVFPGNASAQISCPVPPGTTCQKSTTLKFNSYGEIPEYFVLCENSRVTWKRISSSKEDFKVAFPSDPDTFGTANISSKSGKVKTNPAHVKSGTCVDVKYTIGPVDSKTDSKDPHVIVLAPSPIEEDSKQSVKKP
jgi:hypothetical protein